MHGAAADLPVALLRDGLQRLQLGGAGASDFGSQLFGDPRRGLAERGVRQLRGGLGRRPSCAAGSRRRAGALRYFYFWRGPRTGGLRRRLFRRGLRCGLSPGTFTVGLAGQLAVDVARRDVIAQAEEDRLPHHPVARPLGELHFCHQLRLYPGRLFVGVRRRSAERRVLDDERLHQLVELGEGPFVEPAAGVAGIDQLAVVVDPHDQGPEVFATGARRREAADNNLLLEDGFDLQPGTAPDSGLIRAVPSLGHDPLEPFLLRRLEKGLSLAEDMVRILEQG